MNIYNATHKDISLATIARTKSQFVQSLLIGILLMLCMCFALYGCYEVSQDTITADLGETIPLKLGTYKTKDSSSITITKSDFKNDYIYREVDSHNSEQNGSFRAIRIKENIFAIQAMPYDETAYYILFYRINEDSFSSTEPVKGADIASIARKCDVRIVNDEFGADSFDGSADAIVKFLHALDSVEFSRQ
jgi:hypothetical protein